MDQNRPHSGGYRHKNVLPRIVHGVRLQVKAAAAAVPVDVILATAGWSTESTFRRFYKRPVTLAKQMSVWVLQ